MHELQVPVPAGGELCGFCRNYDGPPVDSTLQPCGRCIGAACRCNPASCRHCGCPLDTGNACSFCRTYAFKHEYRASAKAAADFMDTMLD